jgi:phospholipid/cholesterol/gamma-HCH transport system permease protein
MAAREYSPETEVVPANISLSDDGLCCAGAWTVYGVSGLHGRLKQVTWPAAAELVIDCSGIEAFDTAGAWLLADVARQRGRHGQKVRFENLRPEYQILLRLVETRAAALTSPLPPSPLNPLALLGYRSWQSLAQARGMLSFLGESALSLLYTMRYPRHWRGRAVLHNLQHAGFDALPIIGLLSFLIGLVIAYQAATQLARYGANVFVADLIGHSILRELGPMMVAILVAGRSGSAYAAQIGTMKVTEEIDALRTMGVSPFEMLVVPKMIALIIALPLLTVYADIIGVFGGMLVAKLQLDVGFYTFTDRFADAIQPATFLFGIGKAPVFGIIIAMVGCFQGFQATGSADSVGRHTTISVVHAVFLIIVVDAIFSILANVTELGFH